MFLVALVALLLNDGGRYAETVVDLRNSTSEMLNAVTLSAPKESRAQLGQQIDALSKTQSIRVAQYASGPDGITLWTEEDVRGTWVIGTYLAMARGVPVSQALGTPFTVRYQATGALQ